MRAWLTPRCVLAMLLLIGAPAAALGHLLTTWLPATMAAARLQHQTVACVADLEAEWAEYCRIQEDAARLRRLVSERRGQTAPPYLPERQSHAVLEKLGELLRDERISVRQLKLADPHLCALVPPTDVLACEDITLECNGAYDALAECLERMMRLDVPVRCRRVVWFREDAGVRLTTHIEVPFVADTALRRELVGEPEPKEPDES